MSRKHIYIAAAVALAVGAWVWWRRRQAAAVAAKPAAELKPGANAAAAGA